LATLNLPGGARKKRIEMKGRHAVHGPAGGRVFAVHELVLGARGRGGSTATNNKPVVVRTW
jgi:hypothetical protein